MRAQVLAAAGATRPASREQLIEVLAEQRRRALEQPFSIDPRKQASCAAAERGAAQRPLRAVEILLLIAAGLTFITMVITNIVIGDDPPSGAPLLVRLHLPLLMGTIALFVASAGIVSWAATRRRDRALLSWAAPLRGQFGRGIPTVRGLQSPGAGAAIAMVLSFVATGATAVLCTLMGPLVLVISSVDPETEVGPAAGLVMTGIGGFAIVLAAVLMYVYVRLLRRRVARAHAVAHLGAPPAS